MNKNSVSEKLSSRELRGKQLGDFSRSKSFFVCPFGNLATGIGEWEF
jgi:hypothetical protein